MMKLLRLLAAPGLCLALALPAFAADNPPAADSASAPAAAPAPATAPRTAIPFKHEKQSDSSLGFQALAALVLAGLAAYGIVYALKHHGAKGAAGGLMLRQRRVKLLESTRLGRRSVLHVVEYEGEHLLLAETEQKLEVLSRRAPAPQAGTNDA